MLYCIVYTPELDDPKLFHAEFDIEPTTLMVKDWLYEEYGIKVDLDYERLTWHKVKV